MPIAVTIALEMISPMPGTLISRSQPESSQARTLISADTPLHGLGDRLCITEVVQFLPISTPITAIAL